MGTIQIDGSTPKLTIGNATAEDATILFDGNAQDFYIALDDSADDLLIGLGSTVGTTPIIAIDENKLSTFSGAITVGVDDTGHDVKLFGASAGSYALWDESANLLDLRGATAAGPGHLKLTTGELTVVDADKLGRIDFQAPLESSGTDAILVGASIYAEADDTFAAGVNNTDLVFALGKSETAAEKFRFTADTEIGIGGANYGTDGQVLTSGGAGAAVAWEDASGAVTALNNATANELVTIGSTTTELDAEANLTFTGSALQCTATLTVGVDDTGHDVKFFGATSGAYMLWDESTDDLVLAGAANLYLYDAGGGEKLSSDGTDLTISAGADINLTATTDINIPADVGLTFGDDGEKIEGDGTNLTLGAGGFGQFTIFPRNTDASSYGVMSFGNAAINNNHWKFNYYDATHGKGMIRLENAVTGGSNHPNGGLLVVYSGASPDGSPAAEYIMCTDSTATRFQVNSDGDCKNHDNAYGAISDERIKQDIRDANSQWDDIKGLRVRNFKRKDDVRQYGENAWEQIGLIAQETELVSPKLIRETTPSESDLISDPSFGEIVDDTDAPNGDGTFAKKIRVDQNVKAMQYSVLYMKAIKCLQEAQTRIETLEAKVAVLEG